MSLAPALATVTGLSQVTAARIVSPSRYVSPAAGDEVNAARCTAAAAVPSTFWRASPVVASPLRMLLASVVPCLMVAPLVRTTRLWTVADSVCTHIPSGSTSPGLTVYSKTSVSVPEPET